MKADLVWMSVNELFGRDWNKEKQDEAGQE